LRDLFGFRLALRCNTPQASDTILGQGWASAGADASTISGGQRGVGYLLTEGDRPTRIKGFYLADDDVQAMAERAAARRADAWLAAASGDQADDAARGE
jgi:DNA segregation ATPase FtsK/SpoIIIE, S-DNA-T family